MTEPIPEPKEEKKSNIYVENWVSQMSRHGMEHALAFGFPYANWDIFHMFNFLYKIKELEADKTLEENGINVEELNKEIKKVANGYALLNFKRGIYLDPNTSADKLPELLKQTNQILIQHNIPLVSLHINQAFAILANKANIKGMPIPKIHSHTINEIRQLQQGVKHKPFSLQSQEYQYIE